MENIPLQVSMAQHNNQNCQKPQPSCTRYWYSKWSNAPATSFNTHSSITVSHPITTASIEWGQYTPICYTIWLYSIGGVGALTAAGFVSDLTVVTMDFTMGAARNIMETGIPCWQYYWWLKEYWWFIDYQSENRPQPFFLASHKIQHTRQCWAMVQLHTWIQYNNYTYLLLRLAITCHKPYEYDYNNKCCTWYADMKVNDWRKRRHVCNWVAIN